jgi:hypothetical protein
MRRKVNFDEYYKKRFFFDIKKEDKIRSRPRDIEEEKILDLLFEKEIEKIFKKGIIKKIGKRKYKVSL